MKTLTTLFLMLAMLVSGTIACGSKANAIDKMGKLADEMCACKDKACTAEVNKKYETALGELKGVTGAEDDTEKMSTIIVRLMECAKKAGETAKAEAQ